MRLKQNRLLRGICPMVMCLGTPKLSLGDLGKPRARSASDVNQTKKAKPSPRLSRFALFGSP